jgi:hypothetical protein
MPTTVDIEAFRAKHQERFIPKLKPQNERPKRLIGQNATVLLQRLLMRSGCLLDGALEAIKSENVLILALAARAHIETLGLLSETHRKLKNFYDKTIDEKVLDDFLKKACLGANDLEEVEVDGVKVKVPNAVHTADGIRAANFALKKMGSTKAAFTDMYDVLSEFCHPSFRGLTFTDEISGKAVVTFHDHRVKFKEKAEGILIPLNVSLIMFFLLYDEVRDLLRKHEELPIGA